MDFISNVVIPLVTALITEEFSPSVWISSRDPVVDIINIFVVIIVIVGSVLLFSLISFNHVVVIVADFLLLLVRVDIVF